MACLLHRQANGGPFSEWCIKGPEATDAPTRNPVYKDRDIMAPQIQIKAPKGHWPSLRPLLHRIWAELKPHLVPIARIAAEYTGNWRMFAEPKVNSDSSLAGDIHVKLCIEHPKLEQQALAHDGIQRMQAESTLCLQPEQPEQDSRGFMSQGLALPQKYRQHYIEARDKWLAGNQEEDATPLTERQSRFLAWLTQTNGPPPAASLQNADNATLYGQPTKNTTNGLPTKGSSDGLTASQQARNVKARITTTQGAQQQLVASTAAGQAWQWKQRNGWGDNGNYAFSSTSSWNSWQAAQRE